MQTGLLAFLCLLLCTFSVSETRRQSTVDVAFSSSARRRNASAARRRPNSGTDAILQTTNYVTKIQVEDLDEAASIECVRLRELNLCGGGGWDAAGTARRPVRRSSEWDESAKVSSLLLRSPSCRRRLRPFLCVALTPACSPVGEATPASLPPCRTMCSVAAEGCRGVLEARGIEWPAQWTCDQYPVEGLCIDQQPRQGTGLKIGLDHPSVVSGSETFAIEYRGSLQPPPSSAFDDGESSSASPGEAPGGGPGGGGPGRGVRRRSADDSRFFGGWVDVQGLGHTNDYCRVMGTNSKDRILSCALNGTEEVSAQRSYVSKQGFDAGRPRSGFMKDVDGDRRHDYCRCVGDDDEKSQLICMKAGERGFYGSKMQPGSQYTIRIQTDYCRRNGNTFN